MSSFRSARGLLALAAGLSGLCTLPALAQDAQRPNILVIMADDVGYTNVGAYSHGMMLPTPNIDRIAHEGILFTDHYAQPSCTAGRASFITGQLPIRTGLHTVGLPGSPVGIDQRDPTLAKLLKELGYRTAQFGKNHLGDQINSKEVRVINSQGVQLGVLPVSEALRIAREESCDLVEVSPNAVPPVCRIMAYGKFKYQQQKKTVQAKKKHGLGVMHIKEIKLRPRTEEHDLLVKIGHIKRFLTHGDKAKINLMFRGREIGNPSMGKALLDRIIAEIQDIGVVENQPRMEGRNMIMLLAPKT